MDGNTNSLGIRGFLIDMPEFGALRGRPTGALIIDDGRIAEREDYDDLRRVQRRTPIRWIDHGNAAIFPGLIALGKAGTIGTLDAAKEADFIVGHLASLLSYSKNREALGELSTENALALCIYRGVPEANLETYVRGKCIYQAPALAQS